MKKEKININLSTEEQSTVKRLKEMEKSENKIEEAANQRVIKNTEGLAEFTKLTGDLTAGTELGNLIKRMFIAGAKSEEAKEYHTKGMYTEEEVKELLFKFEHILQDNMVVEYLDEETYEIITDSGFNTEDWFNENKKR